MSELLDRLREEFKDEEARYAYVDGHLNASVAAQIRKLRGKRSQQELAEKIGTKQSGISRLENANYSSWKVETLRKLARAFGLRLKISFEEFGTLVPEIVDFEKRLLQRRSYADDPVFNGASQRQRSRRKFRFPTAKVRRATVEAQKPPNRQQQRGHYVGLPKAVGWTDTNTLLRTSGLSMVNGNNSNSAGPFVPEASNNSAYVERRP